MFVFRDRPMRLRSGVALLCLVTLMAACRGAPSEPPPSEASAGPPAPGSGPVATVTGQPPIDRAKAEQIALAWAQQHWSEWGPNDATAFIQQDGTFHVVVGFARRPDAGSVYVRPSGEIVDASIAPRD
jgi:hypothetical protein